jgi:undecaprenyl diphosphate synthase
MPIRNDKRQAGIIESGGVPRHVSIIMDGNGRWARRRFLPRIEGHRAGAMSVRRALKTSIALGVRWLTLYTFSLENWDSPGAEIS